MWTLFVVMFLSGGPDFVVLSGDGIETYTSKTACDHVAKQVIEENHNVSAFCLEQGQEDDQ